MAMRNEFQNELKELHIDLLKMGSVIEKSIDMLIEALQNNEETVFQEIIKRDDIIDQYEMEIEKKCISMILRQQPVAADLRTIATILKIITDLERIADQSSDIAEHMIKMIKKGCVMSNFEMKDIVNMAQFVKKMLTGTIECYVKQDDKEAIKIASDDDIADQYFHDIEQKIQQAMKDNNDFIFQGICYIHIIKYLERMADHCTNICEWVAYRVTGEHKQYN